MATKCIDQTPVASVIADPAMASLSAEALGRVDSARERQPDEAALNGDCDGKSHEPRLVRNYHPAPP